MDASDGSDNPDPREEEGEGVHDCEEEDCFRFLKFVNLVGTILTHCSAPRHRRDRPVIFFFFLGIAGVRIVISAGIGIVFVILIVVVAQVIAWNIERNNSNFKTPIQGRFFIKIFFNPANLVPHFHFSLFSRCEWSPEATLLA